MCVDCQLLGYVCRHPYPPPPLIRPIYDWSEVGETIPQAAPLLDSTLLTQFLSRRVQDITPSSDEQVTTPPLSPVPPPFCFSDFSPLAPSLFTPTLFLSPHPLSLFLPLLSPSYLTLQLFTHSSHSLSLSSLPGSGARILYQGSYCRREHDSDRRGRRAGEGYKFGLLTLLLSHSLFFLSLL